MMAGQPKRIAALFVVLTLACGGETQSDAPPAEAPAPAGLSLADVAGRWSVDVMPMDRDTTLVTFEMSGAADGQNWMMMFPGRSDHVPMRVRADGDSLIAEAGPFLSALREGVNVTTSGAMRLENGMLVGTTTARYPTTGPDSVVVLRTRGTRIQ